MNNIKFMNRNNSRVTTLQPNNITNDISLTLPNSNGTIATREELISTRDTINNNINTINTSLTTVVSNEFTPYLILKSHPLHAKIFTLNNGDTQTEINKILVEANKYRFFRIIVNGTVTGNINISSGVCEIIFNWQTSAKLVGNIALFTSSEARIIRCTIENGQLILGRHSFAYLLSDVNITSPSGKNAIEIGMCSTIFTDQTTGYPTKPINITSDQFGIFIDNNSRFVAGRNLIINTTNTTTKLYLSRGSFASLVGTTIRGDGTDFNIPINSVTAAGIITK